MYTRSFLSAAAAVNSTQEYEIMKFYEKEYKYLVFMKTRSFFRRLQPQYEFNVTILH